MEPNKIDKQFREKLNTREIQPSAQAWDRLDAMLSVAEEKKTRRPFGFLFIAAGILVFVTLGIFFFTQNNTEIKSVDNVVGTAIKKDSVQQGLKNTQTPIVEFQKQNKVVASSEHKSALGKSQSLINKSIINQKTTVNQSNPTNSTIINKDKPIEFQNNGDVALGELPIIETRQVIVIGQDKSTVKSDEALLSVLDKVAKQSTNQKKVVKVDAKSLLSQADGEVEYTFREKIINKVNRNYQEVKVALANRNNKE